MERNQLWDKARKLRIEDQKKLKELLELEGCSFKPQIKKRRTAMPKVGRFVDTFRDRISSGRRGYSPQKENKFKGKGSTYLSRFMKRGTRKR